MGNQQTKVLVQKNFEQPALFQNAQQNLQLIKEVQDNRFGLIRILQRTEKGRQLPALDPESETQMYMSFTQLLTDTLKYTETFQQVQKARQRNHPNLLRFLGYEFQLQSQICGVSNRCTLYYEFFDQELSQEIDRRNKRSDYFNQSELWYLLETGASLFAFLQENQIAHGDIKPDRFMLTSAGTVKIADQNLISNKGSSYIRTYLGISRGYLAPQLLESMQRQEKHPTYDVYKADMYSLGLTMLEAATLVSADQLYNWDNCTIVEEIYNELIKSISARYSQEFVNIILFMLSADPEQRPDFITLHQQYLEKRKTQFSKQAQVPQQYNHPGHPQSYVPHPPHQPQQQKMQPQQAPVPPQNYQNPHQMQQPQTTKVLVPRNSNNQNGPNPNPNQPVNVASSQAQLPQPPSGFQFVTLGNGKVVATPTNPNAQGFYEPQAAPQKVAPTPVNNNQYYQQSQPTNKNQQSQNNVQPPGHYQVYPNYGPQNPQFYNSNPNQQVVQVQQGGVEQDVGAAGYYQPQIKQQSSPQQAPLQPSKQQVVVNPNTSNFRTSMDFHSQQQVYQPPTATHQEAELVNPYASYQKNNQGPEPLRTINQNSYYHVNEHSFSDSPIQQQALQQIFNTDLDDRVNKALRLTEQTIQRNERVPMLNGSPVKDNQFYQARGSMPQTYWNENVRPGLYQ